MEHLEITRDCVAVRIPAGDPITLPQGTEAYLTQSLGGSFTVQVPAYGGLFRIAGSDADALGKDPPTAEAAVAVDGDLEAQVWAALATCYDPEIPVNIVDLGLVYDVRLSEVESGKHSVAVQMTLTAVGCGMGGAIAADAQSKISTVAGVEEASVDIVWEPQWNPRMISEAGRATLGIE
ncbi:MAG: putative FeS assembly SUF system protein SufT [Hyphomicrobiaceae bacterium]|jgi:probable FeS assembly SUF system protein SufT